MKSYRRMQSVALVGLILVASSSFIGWKPLTSTNPKWPLKNGFHYSLSLNYNHFPASSPFTWEALMAVNDIEQIGGTSFKWRYNFASHDPLNHDDGKSTWGFSDRLGAGTLGLTWVRYSGSTILEADVIFNTNRTYHADLSDPCKSQPGVSFRGVALHEAMHAIGIGHENSFLCTMNEYYTDGACIPHNTGLGVLPHADDKHAIRTLYPSSETVKNVMATCWKCPSSGGKSARKESISGTYLTGSSITVPCVVENQSNVSLPGGWSGVTLGFYLSTNNVISTYDTRIGQYAINGSWRPHHEGGHIGSAKCRIPSWMKEGTYYVGVKFDDGDVVSEKEEGDNTCYLGTIKVKRSVVPVGKSFGGWATITSGCWILGQSVTIAGTDAPAGKLGALLRAYPAIKPIEALPGLNVYLDLFNLHSSVPVRADGSGQWQYVEKVQNNAALVGKTFTLQAAFFPLPYGYGIETTHGLDVTVVR